jgi:alkanesulfonate monooxygenase SsuD/methylene tetrahydromethanopterin reductase-like flavin-dependent oxidoreductase (luciferase family)
MSLPVAPKLGLLMPLGATATAQLIADRASEAEEAGFDSAWVIEDYYSWECFASLGYLAAITERIEIGVSVTTPYVRPAALLASAAATLDQFAGGRFTLGLGRCTGTLLGQIGIDDKLPLTTLRETTEALRELWTGGTVSFDGKTITIDRVVPDVLPVRGTIPILFGAIGPKALRLAGEVADGAVLTSFAPIPYVRWAVEQVHAGAKAAGREPTDLQIVAMITTKVTDDVEAAIDEFKPWLGLAYGMSGRGELLLTGSSVDLSLLEPIRGALKVEEIMAEGLEPYLHSYHRVQPADVAKVVPGDLVSAAAMIGSPYVIRQRLDEYAQAGVTHVIVDSPQDARLLIEALR